MGEVQGLAPSENESSIVVFNAIGQRNDVHNSNQRSRALSGEEMNDLHSNRYSCLAEKIEQLKLLKGGDDDATIVQRLSVANQTISQDHYYNN